MRTSIFQQGKSITLFAIFLWASMNVTAQKTIDLPLNIEGTPLQYKGTPIAKKIDPMLLHARDRYLAGENLEKNALLHVRGNEILIRAVAETPETATKVIAQFENIGLKYTGHYDRIINGFLSFDQIEKATKFEHLMNLTYSARPVTKVGSVTSEADAAMNTDIIRKGLGFDGTGVKIGVLSDSYNTLGGAEDGILSGDLPGEANPNGYITPVEVLLDLDFGGIDEGRAMIELIHDIAPASPISFYSAFYGEGAFAQGIVALSQFANCDIIVDDIYYFREPMFQDGVIAKAVDFVANNGVSYFSSAGNSADNAYDGSFNAGPVVNFGNYPLQAHIFPNGDIFQPITLQPNQSLQIAFQWDEPAASLSGFPGSTTDYDLIVLNEDLTDFVALAAEDNIFRDPIEAMVLSNPDTVEVTYNLLIGHYTPALTEPTNNFKLALLRGSPFAFGDLASDFDKPTIIGHPNAGGANAVGAAPYFLTPAFGFEQPVPESFTSLGGLPILFDEDGNRYETPLVRNKPEFTAPDGTNTTFFGGDLEGNGFFNFFGTSAAAPHAAALGALVLQARSEDGLTTSPSELTAILQSSAVDMFPDDEAQTNSASLSPFPFVQGINFSFYLSLLNGWAEGFDFLTGAGLISATNALSPYLDDITFADLELSINSDEVAIYEANTFTFKLTNSGERAATSVTLAIDLPKATPLVGGSQAVASTGDYNSFSRVWTIPTLEAGATATLDIDLFPITLDFILYAQVTALNELDKDSRPANGICCIANEDDEAAFTPSASAMMGLNSKNTLAQIEETLQLASVFPNPVSGFTTVTFQTQLEKVTYSIIDINGKIIRSNTWNTVTGTNSKTLDLSDLAEGVYFIQINQTTPQRIVKMK